jgi:hypothetical protein
MIDFLELHVKIEAMKAEESTRLLRTGVSKPKYDSKTIDAVLALIAKEAMKV